MFYENDGRISVRNLIQVLGDLTALVWVFDRVGLYKNLYNTKSIICTPRFIWRHLFKGAYKQQVIGKGATFQEHIRVRVSCDDCRITMASSPLRNYMHSIHRRNLVHMREMDTQGGEGGLMWFPFPEL